MTTEPKSALTAPTSHPVSNNGSHRVATTGMANLNMGLNAADVLGGNDLAGIVTSNDVISPTTSPFNLRLLETETSVMETPEVFARLYATLEREAVQTSDSVLQGGLPGVSLGGDAPYRLGVTSAARGEGKTTVALHVALSAARNTHQRVCLVDLGLGEDTVCKRLGISCPGDGVVEVVERGNGTLTLIQLSEGGELVLAPSGRTPQNASRFVRSGGIETLLQTLQNDFDVLVVDLPSVGTDQVAPLAELLDGIIMVTYAGVTPKRAVREAVETVGRERIVGIVMNRAKPSGPRWLQRRFGIR